MSGTVNIRNPKEYIENFLFVRDKKGGIVPLHLKPAQERLYNVIREEHQAGRPARVIVLKARQMGFSTVTEAMMFQDAVTRPLTRTLIVAHQEDSTANLFKMNKLFYDQLPSALRPMRKNSNAKELVFENPTKDERVKDINPGLRSSIRCVTAGGNGIGRSDTLTNVHLSEVAFWPGNPRDTLAGILQAVPNEPDTLVVIESTANGYNVFKELWDGAVRGDNGFVPVFFPWFEEPGYQMPVPADFAATEEEKALAAAYGLTDEQLQWRRWAIRNNCSGSVDLFKQEYPGTPEEAFLFSGTPFFNNDILTMRMTSAPAPETVGAFSYTVASEGACPEEAEWTEGGEGYIKVWERPVKGHPYVIGGDTAGDGSDAYVGWVIDNSTGAQVAALHFTRGDIEYARQMWCLGAWYNDALMGIEVNFNTYCSKKLEEWGYPHLYVREEAPDKYTHRTVAKYGWRTDSATRPVMLSALQTMMNESPQLVMDADALREFRHFVYNEQHRPEAEAGEHDDYVMAAAICWQIRGQQSYAVNGEGRKVRWTEDMKEDYRNADAAGKRYLREKWGETN